MNFSLYIAKRYLISKSKSNAINIINAIAIIGIIVGTVALFVVLSVFSGLRDFSLTFSNDFDSDLKINPIKGKSFFITPSQEKQIQEIEGLAHYSKIIEERVLFYFNEKEQVAFLKGVDQNFIFLNDVSKNLFAGQWLKPNTNQAVVGYGISKKLSLGLFDYNNPLQLLAPKPGRGKIEIPEQAFTKSYLIPSGIYSISDDLDSKYVFIDLGLAQEVLEFKINQITHIEIRTKPKANEQEIISKIKEIFNQTVEVKTRQELNSTLHKMLNTENIAVYLIFTLVIIIALFNLVGALIIMILDKKDNLKTLHNLGVEIKDLRLIFLYQGVLLSFAGGIIGLLLGIIIVFIQQKFNLIMITPTLAYPVVFTFQNVFIVLFTILSLGYIASLIASNRVSKKNFN